MQSKNKGRSFILYQFFSQFSLASSGFLQTEFFKLRFYYFSDVRIAWVFPAEVLMIFWRWTK